MKIILIGPRGIGQVYLRYLAGHSIDVYSRDYDENCRQLSGVNVLKELPSDTYDIGIICTPTETHLEYILLLQNICDKVIVEKPLLDYSDAGRTNEIDFNKTITNLPMIGLSNQLRLIDDSNITKMTFAYHTCGPYRNENISLDLLPHAISLIDQFMTIQNIDLIDSIITYNINTLLLNVNGMEYNVSFSQGLVKASELSIRINDALYTRRQINDNGFKVFMDTDTTSYEIEDPMRLSIEKAIYDPYYTVSRNTHNRVISIMEKIICAI